ncbi:MAG: Cft2 family processing exonuclease [Verrucomicrobiales bacterium]|nr:Cft2 family processing exonuclease [Verrucomicrobiales bacterium]
MRLTNLNPDTEIGASCWVVEIDGHRLMMDSGSHPKREGNAAMPMFSVLAHEEVDAIAISHCHHDHVGTLPVAVRHFPRAHVLMPELSYFIVERVLHNSVNVMTRQRDEAGVPEYPLYTHAEVDDIAPLFQGLKYNREIEWASFDKSKKSQLSPTLEFFDAGHALGSAGMMVRGQSQSLFYTGDVCFHDQTLLRAARFDDVKADILVMETTRGNRAVAPGFSRAAEVERLGQAIQRVAKRGGSSLIPTFALGRTQEILAHLALMMAEGKLERQPIYVGGLGRVFTEIYDLQAHRTYRHHSGLQLGHALNIVVLDRNKMEEMSVTGGKIFVLTAGMMTEHTPAHGMAMRMMGDERHAILFVGYADPETPGGRLKQSKVGEPFLFSEGIGPVTRRCELEDFDLTAHANRDELLHLVDVVAPHTVVLGHGDTASRKWFETQIQQRYPKMKIVQPTPGITFDL